MRNPKAIHTFTVYGETKHCHQITIGTARKEFYKGTEIYAIPCKMKLNNPWMTPMQLEFDREVYDSMLEMFKWKEDHGFDLKAVQYFEEIINSMIYYNCNHETGYYLRYYKVI